MLWHHSKTLNIALYIHVYPKSAQTACLKSNNILSHYISHFSKYATSDCPPIMYEHND